MDKRIKDLTLTEFESLVKRIVRKELREYDPDDNLKVKDEVKKILNDSFKDRKKGKQKTLSFEEVFSK